MIEDDWQVPLAVGGTEVAHGSLVWEEPPGPLGWAALGVGRGALRRSVMAVVATLVSAPATTRWALLRVAVFVEPVLPTSLDPSLDRAGTALAAGLTIGAAVVAVRSGQLVVPAAARDRR